MESTEIQIQIREFIVNELLQGDGRGLDEDTDLIDLAVIDSTGMVSLVTFLESTFHIQIPPRDVHPGNFRTMSTIALYVAGLCGERQG